LASTFVSKHWGRWSKRPANLHHGDLAAKPWPCERRHACRTKRLAAGAIAFASAALPRLWFLISTNGAGEAAVLDGADEMIDRQPRGRGSHRQGKRGGLQATNLLPFARNATRLKRPENAKISTPGRSPPFRRRSRLPICRGRAWYIEPSRSRRVAARLGARLGSAEITCTQRVS
jgi:hypothetical protein